MLEIAEGRVLLCGPRLLARSSDSFCRLLLLVVAGDRLVTGFLIPIIRVSGGEMDGVKPTLQWHVVKLSIAVHIGYWENVTFN